MEHREGLNWVRAWSAWSAHGRPVVGPWSARGRPVVGVVGAKNRIYIESMAKNRRGTLWVGFFKLIFGYIRGQLRTLILNTP